MTLLNWTGFLERLEHNQALALELATDLLSAIDVRTYKLSASIDAKDQKLIEQSSHALRGLLSPYGPTLLLLELKSIEESARSRTFYLETIPVEIISMITDLKSDVQIEVSALQNEFDRKNALKKVL
ncbi:MAG: hypothetical protein V4655_05885 [Bdellovibrionota bacterium]